MNEREQSAIISIMADLSEVFNPRFVMAGLIQFRIMSPQEELEMKCSSDLTEEKARIVIYKIMENYSVQTLVDIFRYKDSFNHLADMVTAVTSTEDESQTNVKEVSSMASSRNTPQRIDIFTGSRKKVKKFGHYLKRLIHNGSLDELQKHVHTVERRWTQVRHDHNTEVTKRAEVADFMFTVLECQLASLRIQNDDTYDHPFFTRMSEIIPFTSNPLLSSMSYIARHGAAVILAEPLDAGLSEMMHAKMHSEHLVPCKEAGMVYYQEIDIMVRKYEVEKTDDLKKDMLSRCRLALGQFEHEDSVVKEDFTRMLYLRMANIYLGLNVFGNMIKHITVTHSDMSCAEECLKKVKETWSGMDTRRKMFYYIAKAVLNEKRGRPDLALLKSKLALEMANNGKFKTESASIQTLIEKYEFEFSAANEKDVTDTVKCLDELMEELTQ